MRILIALTLTLITSIAFAANLTKKDVELWLTHAPALQNWIELQETDFDEDALPDNIFDQDAMAKYGIQQLKQAGMYEELNKRVKAAGYSSVEQWVEISQKVSITYMALSLENESTEQGTKEEILAQQKELAKLDMPAESKAMMEEMLAGALVMLEVIESASAADKAAVKPYFNKIRQVLDDED